MNAKVIINENFIDSPKARIKSVKLFNEILTDIKANKRLCILYVVQEKDRVKHGLIGNMDPINAYYLNIELSKIINELKICMGKTDIDRGVI